MAGLTCAAETWRLPFCLVCTIHEVGKLVSPKHLPRRILHRQHLNTVKAVTKEMQCISQTTVQSKNIYIHIYTYPCPKTYSPCHVRTLEISTQRSINPRRAILTTLWEHFPCSLSIYGILSHPPHWTSQILLSSKMSLTVFIFLIALA